VGPVRTSGAFSLGPIAGERGTIPDDWHAPVAGSQPGRGANLHDCPGERAL